MGITVSDLESAIDFYLEVSAGTVVGQFENSGSAIDAVTGYPGVVVRQAFIATGAGDTFIELLEYRNGPGVRIDPDNGNIGAVHVAIEVADLDETLVRLRSRDVEQLSEPILGKSGPLVGFRLLYVLGPDRVRVELVEPPH
jgi:catechol 2,3-dioxygenase-like lactoylglutathione lyase family enzyme